jgi:hypothetical protein
MGEWMSGTAKLKLDLNAVGRGMVSLDGVDISNCVTCIEFKASAQAPTEVRLTIFADVEADVTANLEKIALFKQEPEVATVRTADGRTLRIPAGAQ